MQNAHTIMQKVRHNKKTWELPSMPLQGKLSFNTPLCDKTWFRTGGTADVFFEPDSIADLQCFLKIKPKDIPHYVIGAGSNLLVRDGGVRGLPVSCAASALG